MVSVVNTNIEPMEKVLSWYGAVHETVRPSQCLVDRSVKPIVVSYALLKIHFGFDVSSALGQSSKQVGKMSGSISVCTVKSSMTCMIYVIHFGRCFACHWEALHILLASAVAVACIG